jgi:hypothetical protein
MISALRIATRFSPKRFLSVSGATTKFQQQQPVTANTSFANASAMKMKMGVRSFSLMPEDEVKKRIEHFQQLFVEARYCLEDVTDSQETTYFDEDAEAATEAVGLAVEAFDSLIKDMDDLDQKNGVLRSNGLKVEQLKGELHMAIKGDH